jgi:hypothetical protein
VSKQGRGKKEEDKIHDSSVVISSSIIIVEIEGL